MALLFGVADPSTLSSISDKLTTNWCPVGAVAPELPGNLIGFGQSFEIKGHIAAGQATRGLDLMRTAWGWYLNNPYGTGSTCIEGYLSDGSFTYQYPFGYGNDSSYTSHAHGWSTGPTDALTTYIVGLQLTAPGGSSWAIAPQFGDLASAEAGFTTPLGPFQASWSTSQTGYQLSWNTPSGTSGSLVLPLGSSSAIIVQIDGQDVQTPTPVNGAVTISGSAGSHNATVTYGAASQSKAGRSNGRYGTFDF
jgi:Bacterial alpha-L-rhamnosidase C-terminal domain